MVLGQAIGGVQGPCLSTKQKKVQLSASRSFKTIFHLQHDFLNKPSITYADLQFYRMKFDPSKDHSAAPFLILHNFRKADPATYSPLPPKRNHKKKKLTHFSIICTRRMAARLQEQRLNEPQEEESETEELQVASRSGENEQKDGFFDERELEQGIPLQDVEDEDVLYNLNEVSRASNYSKLQKTLFGMGMRACEEQQQEQNVIINNEGQ